MSARAAMQLRIDAEQVHSDIDYALRSIRVCGGSVLCTGVHAAQLARGRAAAESIGCVVGYGLGGARWGAADDINYELKLAKAEAAELLKSAKADLKAIGGVRQLRLAIGAETAHEYELAA